MGPQRKKEMELGPSLHWGQEFRTAGSKVLQHKQRRTCWQIPPELTSGLSCVPGGVWIWEGSSVQLLSCKKESVSGKINKQPPGNGQLCCCWDIPSVWYCFCLGLPSPAPAWHPATKWKKHFVLSSVVRQGKEMSSIWHVWPKICIRLMWVVDTASPEMHTCSFPEEAAGTSSKNFLFYH